MPADFGPLAVVLAVAGALLCLLAVGAGLGQRPHALRAASVACLVCALAMLGLGHASSREGLLLAVRVAAVPMVFGGIGLLVARSWRAPLERESLTLAGVAVAALALLAWLYGLVALTQAVPPPPAPAPAPPVAVAPVRPGGKKKIAKQKKVVKLEPMHPSAPEPTATRTSPPPVIEASPAVPPPSPSPAPQPEPSSPPAVVAEAAPASTPAEEPVPEEPDWRDALTAVMKTKKGVLRACYEAELKKDPKLTGKLVLAFSVTPEGRVGEASIEDSTLPNPAVGACIITMMRGVRFPFRPEEELHVQFPFAFAPGK